MDYKIVFDNAVASLVNYVTKNNLRAMVLGISGGIDSTVCAAICHEVSKKTGVPLIGRSLTIKNKSDETSAAYLVGKAFCNDFLEVNLNDMYDMVRNDLMFFEKDTHGDRWTNPIANGNIQARLRMIYLYHLAGINKGIVIDTDNLTEHYLGFWTLHGDVGDFKPIFGLWKTQVYELARYLLETYKYNPDMKVVAMESSIALTPTDGLGISESDLDQIGAKSYEEVDKVLKAFNRVMLSSIRKFDNTLDELKHYCSLDETLKNIDSTVIENIYNRVQSTNYKRDGVVCGNVIDKIL